MRRNDVLFIVLELLNNHKDLQYLPDRADLAELLSQFYGVPETGRLGVHGIYRISSKFVFVRLWSSNKQFRFSWKQLTPGLINRPNYQYLF